MLSGHVVNGDTQYQRIRGIFGHVFLQVISFREIFGSNLSQETVFLLLVRHLRDTAEADDAGKAVPPFPRIFYRFGKNREAHLVIAPDGVDLVANSGSRSCRPDTGN